MEVLLTSLLVIRTNTMRKLFLQENKVPRYAFKDQRRQCLHQITLRDKNDSVNEIKLTGSTFTDGAWPLCSLRCACQITMQSLVISKNSGSVDRVVVVWPNVAESSCSCPVQLEAKTCMKKDVTTGKGSLLSCSFGARCKSWPDSLSYAIVLSQFSSPNIFIKPMGLVCVFFFSSVLGGRHCKLQRVMESGPSCLCTWLIHWNVHVKHAPLRVFLITSSWVVKCLCRLCSFRLWLFCLLDFPLVFFFLSYATFACKVKCFLRSVKDGTEIYLTRRRLCAVWTAWKSCILSLQTNSNRRFTELNSFLLAANLLTVILKCNSHGRTKAIREPFGAISRNSQTKKIKISIALRNVCHWMQILAK